MLRSFLSENEREETPAWLLNFEPTNSFNRGDFFSSRVVYYPGSGSDGQPVRLFASSHSAHCFVYADYCLTLAQLNTELTEHGFLGYHILVSQNLQLRDLSPNGVVYHVNPDGATEVYKRQATNSYGFFVILERDKELDNEHGADRIALLFLGADGFEIYDALFCQPDSRSPYAVVIQDHGFGDNYERFDRGGLLEDIAARCDVFPKWLLVAKNSTSWSGFTKVAGIAGVLGGQHREIRTLFKRSND